MSKEDNKFPVLFGHARIQNDGMPDFVKWSMLSEDQATSNHSQSLSKLASRGGLSPRELTCNIKGVGWCEQSSVSESEIKETMTSLAV